MRKILPRVKIGHLAMLKAALKFIDLKSLRRQKCPNLGRLAVLLLIAVINQPSAGAQNSPDPAQQPLRGLTAGASLGVYPQLDKGLLVTPGVHPVAVAVPLSEILTSPQQISGKIEGKDMPRGPYQAVVVSVTNNADRPIVFDGDGAVATLTSGPLPCVPLAKLADLSVLPEQSKSFKKKFVTDVKATTTAAVTVGWAQTIRDQKRFSGPIIAPNGGRYGLDEQRREDELRRFGKRVLWPGDATSGVIYFDGGAPLAGSVIDLPVSSYYDPKDKSTMILRN